MQLHDMIQYGGMERLFESASCFVAARPEYPRTTPLETWQHDPQFAAGQEFHETLQAKSGDGQIRNCAFDPGFAGTPDLHADPHMTAFGGACLLAGLIWSVCASFHPDTIVVD